VDDDDGAIICVGALDELESSPLLLEEEESSAAELVGIEESEFAAEEPGSGVLTALLEPESEALIVLPVPESD
jgi:hypothetical protein